MTSNPFDFAAREYDRTFTDPIPGRWFRNAVWSHVTPLFKPGDHILDLGCGTGEDTVWMANQGISIFAVDASSKMIEMAHQKAVGSNVSDSITFRQADFANLSLDSRFDGALSNFGAVNCVENLNALAEQLSIAIKPGGRVVFVVMGPYCPWEIIWYLLHGRVGQAFRRFRSSVDAHVANGKTIRIWYPSPKRFQKEFAPFFEKEKIVGIGSLTPPPYMGRLVAMWKTMFKMMWRLEHTFGSYFPLTWLNDHFLMVLKRK